MKHVEQRAKPDRQRASSRATVAGFFRRALSFFGAGRNASGADRPSPHETERQGRQTEIAQLLEQLEALYAELPEERSTRPAAEIVARLHHTKQQLRAKQLELLQFERLVGRQLPVRNDDDHADELAFRRAARLMRSSRFGVRCAAATQLGRLQHPEALAILVGAKEDPDDRVRVAVLDALANQGSDAAVEVISGFVNDENQQLRLTALRALAKLAPEASRRRLISALDDRTA